VKIIGLMVIRNEQWIVEESLRRALEWVDGMAIMFDRCDDNTQDICLDILSSFKGPSRTKLAIPGPHWNEMDIREANFNDGRALGGTHFAIIDADEMLTTNLLPVIRELFENLDPAELLELPMYAVREGLLSYQDDKTVWSHSKLTLGFKDDPRLGWAPRHGDGYQHHARPPRGSRLSAHSRPIPKGNGGAFHFQFANKKRLLAKHVLYRMVDHLRWPGRRTPERLNDIFDEALKEPVGVSSIPQEWKEGIDESKIDFNEQNPWHEKEIKTLLEKHGRDAFKGLDLKGY